MIEIPNVDIRTGKISNCSPKSKEYYHEKGHLMFQKSKVGSTLQYLFETSQIYLLGSLSLSFFINFFKYISLVLFLSMILFMLYEEYKADVYAEQLWKDKSGVKDVNTLDAIKF